MDISSIILIGLGVWWCYLAVKGFYLAFGYMDVTSRREQVVIAGISTLVFLWAMFLLVLGVGEL